MNLFDKAKEKSKYKECDGCHQIKSISEFKKANKYCNGCPYVVEIREKYKNQQSENLTSDSTIADIEDIDLDDFFN